MLVFCVDDIVYFNILGCFACVEQALHFCRNGLDFVFVLALYMVYGETVLQDVIENFSMAGMRLDASG